MTDPSTVSEAASGHDRCLIEESFPVKEGDHLAGRGSPALRPFGYTQDNPAQDISQSPTSALFPDTRPEAEAVLIGLLRQAPPWRKLIMVGQLNQAVRTLALSGLRTRHPEATPQELRRRLADLLLGPDLAAQVYGPLGGQEVPDAL